MLAKKDQVREVWLVKEIHIQREGQVFQSFVKSFRYRNFIESFAEKAYDLESIRFFRKKEAVQSFKIPNSLDLSVKVRHFYPTKSFGLAENLHKDQNSAPVSLIPNRDQSQIKSLLKSHCGVETEFGLKKWEEK